MFVFLFEVVLVLVNVSVYWNGCSSVFMCVRVCSRLHGMTVSVLDRVSL